MEEPLNGKLAAVPLTDTDKAAEPRGRVAGLSPGKQKHSVPEGPTPPQESLRWPSSALGGDALPPHPEQVRGLVRHLKRGLRPDCKQGEAPNAPAPPRDPRPARTLQGRGAPGLAIAATAAPAPAPADAGEGPPAVPLCPLPRVARPAPTNPEPAWLTDGTAVRGGAGLTPP